MTVDLAALTQSDIRSAREPAGTHSFTTQEHDYLDGRKFDLHRATAIFGGLDIPEPEKNTGIKAAIPSQIAWHLSGLILYYRSNHRDLSPKEQVLAAMKDTLLPFCNNGILFDVSSDDEVYLRRVLTTDELDARVVLREHPNAMPKAFKRWDPKRTKMIVTAEGFEFIFRDNEKRALIRAVIGNFEEDQSQKSINEAPMAVTPLAQHFSLPSFIKQQTSNTRHQNALRKKQKAFNRLSLEAKRSLATENDDIDSLDTESHGVNLPFKPKYPHATLWSRAESRRKQNTSPARRIRGRNQPQQLLRPRSPGLAPSPHMQHGGNEGSSTSAMDTKQSTERVQTGLD
ncbi:hypothetical protein E8E14_013097 [Neopestalotiopsis sp. 37M]|nr:hypothetical protein E8E14_013097 [Neopestalotiopsis sp. 37M]